MNYSTDSQLTSSSEFEFLSSTEPTEAGLPDREIRKRADPEFMAPIPGPESQLKRSRTSGAQRPARHLTTFSQSLMICS